MKDIILSSILKYIAKNYGSQEWADPYYDVETMASEIAEAIENSKISEKKDSVEKRNEEEACL